MFETKPTGGLTGPRTIDYPNAVGKNLLAVPNSPLQDKSSSPIAMATGQIEQNNTQKNSSNIKSNYKQKLNKAANSLVNFAALGDSASSSTAASLTKESMDSLDQLSKVVQMCVADMIKYSIDLFTVSNVKLTLMSSKVL